MDPFTLPAAWTTWGVATLAILPAMLVWRLYAPLLRRLDDPVLPERLAHRRAWSLGITIAGIAIVAAVRPRDAFWSVPLVLVAQLRVTYGVRRILLGENLTFSSYLFWVARFMIAIPGGWVLLAVTPAIVLFSGDYGPLVAIVLGTALVLWTWRSSDVLLRLLRATPLDRDDLRPRFAALVDKTDLTPPRVWQAGEPGAVFANAFALPSLRGASILFTRTLLERLDADELTAVFGHELAHLEEYKPARLQRLFLLTLLMAVAATLLTPAALALGDAVVWPALVLWPLFVVTTMVLRASRVHANELASDRRAVDLCGNPDALASGLTKIHTIARLPARWEAQSTIHPSLARRIRAIREIAGQGTRLPVEPTIVDGLAPDACLLFETTTVRCLTGVPADAPRDPATVASRAADVRCFPYNDIRTCRLVARGQSPPELLIVDRRGRRFSAPFREADVPRLQQVLDSIEPQIADTPPAVGVDNRFVALIALVLSLLAGPSWSVAFVSILALLRPATDLLIAASVMMIASGLFGFITPARDTILLGTPGLLIAAGALLLILVLLPRRRERTPELDQPARGLAVVALAAVVTWAFVLLQWEGGMLRLVQAVRASAAIVVLPIGAALLCARTRARHRWALASACLLAALVPAAIAPAALQPHIVRDPLLVEMPELPRVPARLTLVAHAELQPGEVIRVSPDARSVASGWSESADPDEPSPSAFAVRAADGHVEQLTAIDLQFLDDRRVLLLRATPPGLELALHTLAASEGDGGGERDLMSLDASPTSPARAGAIAHTATSPSSTARPTASAQATSPASVTASARVPATGMASANAAPGMATSHAVAPAHAIASPRATVTAGATAAPRANADASRRHGSAPAASAASLPGGVREAWTLRLPDFATGRLSVDPRTGRWRVAGRNRVGEWVRVQGVLGNEILDEARWTRGDTAGADVLFEAGRALVGVRYAWSPTLLGRLAPRLATLTTRVPAADVSLWRIDADRATPLAESQADVTCLEAEVNAGGTVCLAFDGIDTRVWAIDAEHGALTPVGLLRGYARALSRGLDGSILVWWQHRPTIVHPRSPRAIELTPDARSAAYWRGGAYTPGHLVLVSGYDPAPAISTYRVALDERVIPAGPPERAAADRVMLDGR